MINVIEHFNNQTFKALEFADHVGRGTPAGKGSVEKAAYYASIGLDQFMFILRCEGKKLTAKDAGKIYPKSARRFFKATRVLANALMACK